MKTVIVNSQKGGSGKTTLCGGLAVEAAKRSKVCLIDTDPQGTLSQWHDKREAEQPFRIETTFEGIGANLTALAGRGTDYTFIDTVPSRDKNMAELFKHADLVLVPVLPSPADVWAVIPTVELLKGQGTPFLFVLNKVKPNTRLTAQAAVLLSHYGPVAQSMIFDRTDYAAALTDGRTGPELNAKGKAAEEIATLWRGVQEQLTALEPKEKAHA